MKNFLSLLVFVFLFTQCETSITDSQEGMSEERLNRIDRMIEAAIDSNYIPGAVVLVSRNGTTLYHKAFGMSHVADSSEFKTDDIFRIASQTKAITSTAVMILWEEGHFSLDDPVSLYIPAFRDMYIFESFNEADSSFTGIPATKPVTIRHLLTHTSGIGYGMIDSDPFRKMYQKKGVVELSTTEDVTIEENVKRIAQLPLHHEPGERWTYGMGLDVLGYLVEVISGQPFNEFLRDRIFDPLEMDDTWFYLPEEKHTRLVPVQTKDENGNWVVFGATDSYDPDYPIKGARSLYNGGAGLSSTATDYANFLQMYLNDGEFNGQRILSRTTVDLVLSNHAGELFGENRHQGLAFGIVTEDGKLAGGVGSTGTFEWGGYFNTQYFADPEENIIGIIMKQTQNSGPDPTAANFRRLIYAAIND